MSTMEKYNWFQNNMGSYIVVHNDGATETYIASAGNAEKAHFITTACNQLATDGREELEKRIKQLEFDEAFDKNEITALQSQCTEKDQEIERLKLSIREGIPAAVGLMETISNSKSKQIDELKAENERLKYLVERAFWADDIIKFKEEHGL